VINTLKSGKVCRVAPIPGETKVCSFLHRDVDLLLTSFRKVWQYITLTRKIYLIDCPGIVPGSAHDTQTAKVLKGVVRVEALPTPSEHIPTLISRVKPVYLARTYNLEAPGSGEEFDPDEVLDRLARMKGRLLKGGEPDLDGVAKILLSDWVRGKIPYFIPPPERPEDLNKTEEAKRKREEAKGKGREKSRAVEEEREERLRSVGVRQNLGSIMQKNTFVGEDVRPIDGEGGEEVEEEEGEGDVEGEEEQGDELGWNDVFPEDAPPTQPSDDEASEDESDEEEDQVEGM
jgi:nuclear GTP-binding protein